jgi:hypothetical protein
VRVTDDAIALIWRMEPYVFELCRGGCVPNVILSQRDVVVVLRRGSGARCAVEGDCQVGARDSACVDLREPHFYDSSCTSRTRWTVIPTRAYLVGAARVFTIAFIFEKMHLALTMEQSIRGSFGCWRIAS